MEMNQSLSIKHGVSFPARVQLRSPTGMRKSCFDELSGAFAGSAVMGVGPPAKVGGEGGGGREA